jgi:hypothetical protein
MLEMAMSIRQELESIIATIPNCELYQLQLRMHNTVKDLPEKLTMGFSRDSRLARIRTFIEITGSLQECKDYLELLNRIKIGDYSDLMAKIDNMTELLMVNSGSLN